MIRSAAPDFVEPVRYVAAVPMPERVSELKPRI